MTINLPYLLALHQIYGLVPIRLKALIDYYHDSKLAWMAKQGDLSRIDLSRNVVGAILQTRNDFDVEKHFQGVEKDNTASCNLYFKVLVCLKGDEKY